MKTIDIAAFLLTTSLLLGSCSSDGDDVPEVIVPQDATLTLAIAPGSVLTKTAASETPPETKDGEKKINNICAALFKEDGSLLTSAYVDYKNITGETPDTIRISAKSDTKYTYVVLVNVGNQTFSNLEELKSLTYVLQNIHSENQPMCSRFITIPKLKPGANYYGPKDVFPKASEDEFFQQTSIPVYRTASRIDFESINVSWSDVDADDLKKENARFRLKRIYVINAKNATHLVDQEENGNSVELDSSSDIFLNGRDMTDPKYFGKLDLFPTGDDTSTPIINVGEEYAPVNKWQCYITENTDKDLPTALILKGDILHKEGNDNPILKDRFFFIRLEAGMKDTQGNTLPGVIRNYVIRIKATITGKGSGDEIYRENAYATVTVTPDAWSVETQHEDVN